MSQRRSGGNKSRATLTQESEEVADPTEIVNNIVRYIINRAGNHSMITKSELVRNVIQKSKVKFEEIIQQVTNILENVYGYNLILCETQRGKEKHFLVSNRLTPISGPDEEPDDYHKILILLILSHIFMSNNEATDSSLYAFLKSCGIDVDVRHPTFGLVKQYINKDLIKQQYLVCETDTVSYKPKFKWGVRAQTEISQMKILNFVCKMYKNITPEGWTAQYQVAREQGFQNYQENVGELMDQD